MTTYDDIKRHRDELGKAYAQGYKDGRDEANAKEVTEAMALAGARSIGNTIHTDNHLERARECWRAMWAARDGIMEPVPRERRP